jgi:hypothetical protein
LFVPGKPFQLGLILAAVGSSLAYKHEIAEMAIYITLTLWTILKRQNKLECLTRFQSSQIF